MSAPDEGAHGDYDMAPGGPRAVTQGCLCSVLANAAYRSHAEEQPFVDPECPLHTHPASATP